MKKKNPPLKRGTRIIPLGKAQVNLNVDKPLIDKLKGIAMKEGLTFSEIYIAAFERFVELYEKKNGPVNFEKGQGLKKL